PRRRYSCAPWRSGPAGRRGSGSRPPGHSRRCGSASPAAPRRGMPGICRPSALFHNGTNCSKSTKDAPVPAWHPVPPHGTPDPSPPSTTGLPLEFSVTPGRKHALMAALATEIAAVVCFAVVYSPFDLHVYLWGGHAVAGDARLYLDQVDQHWFT